MKRLLSEGKTVVLDEENLYGPSFTLFVGMAHRCKAKTKFQLIKTDVEVCKARCLQSGGSSADVMRIEMLAEKYALVLKK